MTLEPGSRLGRYLIEAPIGAGGMGEVYRAKDTQLERLVALKVLRSELAADPDRLMRFEREAKAAGMLRHPNVVTIFDVGCQDGTPFVVTELLEGETLRARLARERVTIAMAARIGQQIAHALSAAHKRGIVHRDLKPENVFLVDGDEVKLLDFGVAKLQRVPVARTMDKGPLSTLTFETEPGVVIGTVGYMAPEQVLGRSVDHRADLFSLGAILFEMIQGNHAFGGDTPVERLAAVLKDAPAEVLDADPSEPARLLRQIVRRCLEKKPADRYADAAAVAAELERVRTMFRASADGLAQTETDHTPDAVVSRGSAPASRPRHVRTVWMAAAAAIAATLAFAAGRWSLQEVSAPSPAPAATALASAKSDALPRFTRLSFRAGGIASARFSADGRTVAYGAFFGDEPLRVHIVRTDNPASRALEIDGDVLAVSRQGEMAVSLERRMAYWPAEGTLAVAPLMSGAPRPLREDVLAADYEAEGGTMVVARYEGGKVLLERPLGKEVFRTDGWVSHLRVDPKGARVAFFLHPFPGDSTGGVSVLEKSGEIRALTEGWMDVNGLAWAPSGNEVWFSGASQRGPLEIAAVDLTGRVRRVLQSPGRMVLHDVAADGRALVTLDDLRAQVIAGSKGSDSERDLSILDQSVVFDMSDDGTRVLVSEQSAGGRAGYDVYMRANDGSPAMLLGEGLATSLSRDGAWAASVVENGAAVTLLPTGPGALRRLSAPGLSFVSAELVGDGKKLVALGTKDGAKRFYLLATEGSGEPAAISPPGAWLESGTTGDGKLLVARNRDGEVWAFPTEPGQSGRLVTKLARHRVLTDAAGNGDFYVLQRATRPPVVYRLDLTTGALTKTMVLASRDVTGTIEAATFVASDAGESYAYTGFRQLSTLMLVEGAL